MVVYRDSSKLAQLDTTYPHLATPALPGYPPPNSPGLIDLGMPAWRRLINHTFSPHEAIPLIEAMFMTEDEVEMIGCLRGDDAQTLINVIDEVGCYTPSSQSHGLIAFILFDTFTSEPSPPLIRLWVSPILHYGSGGSV